MKHILNDLTEQEKNSIREQHTGGMKVMTENFNKLISSKLGDSKPLFEQKEEENESFWGDMFGKPSIDRATHDSLRGQGYSQRGRDDEDEHYVMFNGEKFYDDDIEYADYNDLGKLPRIEDGKLIVTNPAWEL
jgi:hypothetical protein